ncbi:beta-galactosidase [Brevundimonas sp. R86498]|uniref:beta-galactosidase n=1 Tax=Brevundimonas sp. R86498 TaxID=3093845 RepID=UPI0037C8EFE8
MTQRILAGLAATLWFTAAPASGGQVDPRPAPDGLPYVLTSFSNGNATTMSVYSSTDAATFTPLNLSAFTPPTGLIRDPSLIRRADGWYHVVYTTDWNNNEIGFARSRDLVTWEHVRNLEVPLAGVTNTWAPEWFVDEDGSTHVIYALSRNGPDGQFQPHIITALDDGLTTWSAPRPLAGLGPNYIDTFIVREGGLYQAFIKNETTKFIERATSHALDGPWTVVDTGDWAGWGAFTEGQALVRRPDGGWRIYFDEYVAKRYWYSDSDDLRRWTPRTELPGLSGTVRHFTVLNQTPAPPPPVVPAPAHRITWDSRSLMIDGQRTFIWGGEMHPFRLPSPALWRDVLQKLKATGYNTVAFYFAWGYHSPAPGEYDFTGVRDMDLLLRMAAEEGLYVIVRPGPYINSEVTRGGFPGWLTTQSARSRTDAPEYLQAAEEWLGQINAIIARHQLTDGGGTVIAYQIENELDVVSPAHARYMQRLYDRAREDGITVPIFHNDKGRNGIWTPRDSDVPGTVPGPVDLYAFDGYPGGGCNFDGTTGGPTAAPDWGIYGPGGARGGSSASPNTPGFVAEFGGGWFDHWGSNGLYPCTSERIGSGYQRVFYGTNIANALTIQSFYMTFGGTSWGWMPAPVVYSSYDYGAAIDEARGLRPKALTMKLMGQFLDRTGPILAAMEKGRAQKPTNPNLKVYHNLDPATGTHLYVVTPNPSNRRGDETISLEIATADGTYAAPQSGVLRIRGQDAKMLLAAYDLERQRLVYSTSELQTHLRQDDQDVALFYGRAGEDGETVLRYTSAPTVEVIEGEVTSVFDAARGDLRLNYVHEGLKRVRISGGGRAPLLLLIGDEAAGQTFWRQDTSAGAVLQRGPTLVRTATAERGTLALTGDTEADTPLEIWAPAALRQIRWNGQTVAMQDAAGGGRLATRGLAGPAPVVLPDLTRAAWRYRAGSPEAAPDFDDSSWRLADSRRTASPTRPPAGQPILTMDDYGFHHGDVWYRGRYQGGQDADRLTLHYGGGGGGMIQVWLDGQFLGQHELPTNLTFPVTTGSAAFDIPETLRGTGDHVLSVMVRNNGNNWNLNADDAHKEGRGLVYASLTTASGPTFAVPIQWRIQGVRGGQDLADPVRGPMNNGGLFGEREGWHLPEHNAADWTNAAPSDLPAGEYWLRTEVDLDLPRGHDHSLALTFGDPDTPRSPGAYRVLVFVNGWQMGQFISNIGPQRTFVLPTGVLNPNGRNVIALAVTSDGDPANAVEDVRLVALRTARGGPPALPRTAR